MWAFFASACSSCLRCYCCSAHFPFALCALRTSHMARQFFFVCGVCTLSISSICEVLAIIHDKYTKTALLSSLPSVSGGRTGGQKLHEHMSMNASRCEMKYFSPLLRAVERIINIIETKSVTIRSMHPYIIALFPPVSPSLWRSLLHLLVFVLLFYTINSVAIFGNESNCLNMTHKNCTNCKCTKCSITIRMASENKTLLGASQ